MSEPNNNLAPKTQNIEELEFLEIDTQAASDDFRSTEEEPVMSEKEKTGKAKKGRTTPRSNTPYSLRHPRITSQIPTPTATKALFTIDSPSRTSSQDDDMHSSSESSLPPPSKTQPSDDGPDPDDPQTTSQTTQTMERLSRYQEYIRSPDFLTMSPWVALSTCNELSKLGTQEEKEFWEQNYPLLKTWLSEPTAAAFSSFLHILPLGIQAAKIMISGINVGIAIENSRAYKNLVAELSGAIETSGIMMTKLHKESEAHRQQSLEFVSQISQASDTVARLQSTVEKFKLESLQAQLTPKMTTRPTFDQPSTSISTPMAVSPPPPSGTPVELICTSGTYLSQYGTIKLDGRTLTSIDSTTSGLKSLRALQGKPLPLCYIILNKNLSVINDRASLDPNWISYIFEAPQDQRQNLMIKLMEQIPNKTFQWERKDSD